MCPEWFCYPLLIIFMAYISKLNCFQSFFNFNIHNIIVLIYISKRRNNAASMRALRHFNFLAVFGLVRNRYGLFSVDWRRPFQIKDFAIHTMGFQETKLNQMSILNQITRSKRPLCVRRTICLRSYYERREARAQWGKRSVVKVHKNLIASAKYKLT